MKFTSTASCSCRSFGTFTFTVDSLLSQSSARSKCQYIVLPGNKRRYAANMEYKECGQNRTCFKTGANIGPGCYCKEGFVLNGTTGFCQVASPKCNQGVPDKPLNLIVPKCLTAKEPVSIAWKVDASRKYSFIITNSKGIVKRKGNLRGISDSSIGFTVTGSEGTLIIPRGALDPDQYTVKITDTASSSGYSEDGKFSIKAGCNPSKKLNIDINPFCDISGVQRTQIRWDVRVDRSYSFQIADSSGSIIAQGNGTGSGGTSFSVSRNKAFLQVTLKPGDYSVTVKDLTAGDKDFYSESKGFSVTKCLQPHPFNLRVPECVQTAQNRIDMSWKVKADRQYSYKVQVQATSSTIASGTVSGGRSTGNFAVSNGRGTLTIRSSQEWPVGTYIVTVRDLSSSVTSEVTDSFEVRKGCKPIRKLEIDASGRCQAGKPNAVISWSVQRDRTYKYTILQEKRIVQEGMISGSGNNGFSVLNGRGHITKSLEPGAYKVKIYDLHAGINEYYAESKGFTVPVCELEIRAASCVVRGEKIPGSLSATAGYTYTYTIEEESTGHTVRNGIVPGAGQNGGSMTFKLESTPTLPVGRYLLLVTEKETGAQGYARISVSARGDISPKVKYTVEAEHSGVYICLDPVEGISFDDGLTVKIGASPRVPLQGRGKCTQQAYSGQQRKLTVSVRNSAGRVDNVQFDYIG
jgi:hypothetical protein